VRGNFPRALTTGASIITHVPMDELEPTNKQRIGPVLWRERYVILASVVVMVALAAAYALTAAKTYQATAILQVNVTTANPGTSDTTNANQALAQNYATLLVSSGFLHEVRPQIDGGRLSLDSLKSRLSASAPTNSALVELHATGSSPSQAQRVAQDVVNGFLRSLQSSASNRTSQLQSQLQQQVASLSSQITSLSAKATSPTVTQQINSLKAAQLALINQNATLVANGLAQGTSAQLSSAPVASSTPISPKKTLDIVAGLLLGLLLGVAVAWLRQRVRPAIHSAEEVTALVNVPLLASIPLKSRFRADDPTIPEAYGVLQANMIFALRGGDRRVVTFVGYNPQVGKTSTVEGLAKASGRGDRRVLAIDGDMRMATLSSRFGYRDHPGLVEVLQGNVSVDDALVQVEDDLWLLPTHPSRVNAGTLLSGGRTLPMIADLRERFDLVLVDSPPLSGLADGLILASHSDAVVLVARAGLTKPGEIVLATNSLHHITTPIAGVVVFEELPVERYYGAHEADSGRRPAPVAP
jgi:Mrp family chromosome partitioning ATPase